MRSFSLAAAITLGCSALGLLPVACGDTSSPLTKPDGSAAAGGADGGATGEDGGMSAGGAGGAAAPAIPGTSGMASTIKCGSEMCSSIKALSPSPLYVNPCCAGDAEDACGLSTEFFVVLNTSFDEQCQRLHQEGPLDTGCPASPEQMLPYSGMLYHIPGFAGCCRAETGTCGVVIDKVTVSELGGLPFASPMLGCADSAPFFGGVAGKACGAGGEASGGAAAGGEASGGAAAGGAAAGGAAAGGAG